MPSVERRASDGATARSRAKSDRRGKLIAAAERLVAERGYLAVRLEDIGAAAGVSGPAIYRHFPNKEALLVELLVGISTRLLDGATDVVARVVDPRAALDALIDFHLDFALEESDLIRIQDRDLSNLPDSARRLVRRKQRQYVEIWVDVLQRVRPELGEEEARVMAHATFGLLNSTPHSLKPNASKTAKANARTVLREMTVRALTQLPAGPPDSAG
ncbi:bacterial regulatory s, tetR family protein [Mycolicibacterium hassiacum DSM 44199]|jgi:AcrR family transcriptional regulator|uniref:Bacterial regulatory s, tetR family protein n=1 Tax=Mycolicibacterium hassiacum (strain DSM 44199 / CIP 105218 / JCM 12690 / 3849) TaxID=1122247 RepID=K5BAW7_MYCHD|nr:TetR/AcrR family transcriptional regulator [Mycolicibacterium hassiacum]EKF22960.1 bacterial regulatory s, tetR family protein [Mycolicibacterium hassiacum DSM 44199]MBX5487995.1 TetR/AcrR family transcriptional regulator [Mycolicibacterium hassiacum]MDA4087271.1 TetR family transcriptional regulator [Mycolicibacterium hassiacum DSM 44199]VCT89416.1 HTH-type transcriptional repressor KstR2 [Mycolicibacterium hassiacum DSM 44199]